MNLSSPLQKGQRDTLSLGIPANLVTHGVHEFVVRATLSNPDYDPVNNVRYFRFNHRATRALPLAEDFENGIGAANWYNYNEDQAITWDTIRVPDAGGQKLAAYMNYLDYEPRANQVDQLWSPQLSLPAGAPVTLRFDVAYQEYVPVGQLYDTLKVLVSTDCGASFTEIYKKFGADLNTTGNTGPGFIPQNRGEWRRDSVDLSAFAGQEVLVIFEGVNRNGNDLFLDNISIYSGQMDPLEVREEHFRQFSLYPVPVKDQLHISGGHEEVAIEYRITDLSGKLIREGHLGTEQDRVLSLSKMESGTYLIEISAFGHIEVHRFVKN